MNLVAYIDAGTGSYLLAAIAGGTAGAWFLIRAKVSAVRRKLSRSSAKSLPEEPSSD